MNITRDQLIGCFRDTLACIRREPALQASTAAMQAGTRLYPPEFAAAPRMRRESPDIDIVADTTFHCAQRYSDGARRVAVLNFANPWTPGGGVAKGVMAQEECLCRSSDLYAALTLPNLARAYYECNAMLPDPLGTDAVIWSPGVTVFKSDDDLPVRLDAPFQVDVLTCAAPYLDPMRSKPIPRESLEAAILGRIVNILEVASANDVDVLVLGAFGCGAFNNPPDLVAGCFRRALIDMGLGRRFEKVLFAIKASRGANPNLEAFQRAFGG